MSRIAYVNGRYVPHDQAGIHIDDRGYQFGDGIYEVVSVIDGKLADQDWHLDRMEYSLNEISIPMPMSRAALKIIIKNMIMMNRIRYGLVYFQITRGVMRRDHIIDKTLKPQLIMTARPLPMLERKEFSPVAVITVPDQRWQRRDIKTLQLLPNCIAKTKAVEAGAYEAWMVGADGYVTEGTSSNAWIVSKKGELITRPISHDILSGITRKAIIEIASVRNLKIVERPFTPEEALKANEAFLTSASSLVTPVASLDGKKIGDGQTGPVAAAMLQAFLQKVGAATV
jgi:D-alanine transaminase